MNLSKINGPGRVALKNAVYRGGAFFIPLASKQRVYAKLGELGLIDAAGRLTKAGEDVRFELRRDDLR